MAVWLHSNQTSGCSVEDFLCHFCPDLLALGNPFSFVSRVRTLRVCLPHNTPPSNSSHKAEKGNRNGRQAVQLCFQAQGIMAALRGLQSSFPPAEEFLQVERDLRNTSIYCPVSCLSRALSLRREREHKLKLVTPEPE